MATPHDSRPSSVHSLEISDALIEKVSALVNKITGVQLGASQKVMVQSRLVKRLSDLKLSSSEDYLDYLAKNEVEETQSLVSLLTTHHTYFFREFAHFEHLQNKILPRAISDARARGDKKIRVWSAACSHGQEVYSLSMFLQYCLKTQAPDCTYEILGTDVDSESVAIARNGVYQWSEIKEAPMHFIAGNWARGTGEIAAYVKAKNSIRTPCKFDVANLLNLPSPEKLGGKFDVIFCRNVFIYFKPDQIREITKKLQTFLTPRGTLTIGISESLIGLDTGLVTEAPSVYVQKTAVSVETTPKAKVKTVVAEPVAPAANIRVLCVDDSGSILTLLKKILAKEHGFEIVGTAQNGIEAKAKCAELKPDVLTLDIHMPEQDGIQYLTENFKGGHPPVMMLSSVSRENADLALKALSLGASDYVEKPSLQNVHEKGEEIRLKLRTMFKLKQAQIATAGKLELETQFKSTVTIPRPEEKLRVIACGLSDGKKLVAFFRELQGDQPPTAVLLDGSEAVFDGFAAQLRSQIRFSVELGSTVDFKGKLKKNAIVLISPAGVGKALFEQNQNVPTSILVYGRASEKTSSLLAFWMKSHILVEDLGDSDKKNVLVRMARDIVPATSFAFMSCEFLSKLPGASAAGKAA